MNIIVKQREETDISYEQIVKLMHDAFEERLQQSLNFKCSSMTVDEFKKNTASSTILVAIDLETGMFLGFGVITIKEFPDHDRYASVQDISVSPKFKCCGIGSKLEREIVCTAKNSGCKYLECTTAVGAESSVKFHLKQGYKIVGLTSFPTTNYYSYIFRMYLQPSIWHNSLFCKMRFVISYLKTHLLWKEDGSHSLLGCILKKCRSKNNP